MNKPQQYIKGWTEFYKLRFKVSPDVLIPRPETELLVDEVLNFLSLNNKCQIPNTILDLGTGAGAIAIALAKQLSTLGVEAQIIASDISQQVLEIAKQNAKLHGVENKIIFITSDLLSAFPTLQPIASHTSCGNTKLENYSDIDIIVTNLPYIPSTRIPYLESSVKDFEPHVALDGGEDGFELYRKLFAQIKERNWHPKLIVGEIDYTHGALAWNEAYRAFPGANIEVKKDLAHLQRILLVKQ